MAETNNTSFFINDVTDYEFMNTIAFALPLISCLTCVCELNIADLLEKHGAMTIEELGAATKTIPSLLYRVMRCLTRSKIFEECDTLQFCNTPRSRLLLENEHGSYKDAILVQNSQEFFQALHQVKETLVDGVCGVKRAHNGMSLWQVYQANPERSVRFNKYMTFLSTPMLDDLALAYDYAKHESIVDIGGGRGSLLQTIRKHHPQCKELVVYDLANVVQDAKQINKELEFIAGSFFESVPAGYDAYILKCILHDHKDEPCCQILGNIRKSMKPGSRLLICESIVPDTKHKNHDSVEVDIVMMTVLDGKERTRQEFDVLLGMNGFQIVNIHIEFSPCAIIECALLTQQE